MIYLIDTTELGCATVPDGALGKTIVSAMEQVGFRVCTKDEFDKVRAQIAEIEGWKFEEGEQDEEE
jgi:hypothetical protein